MVNNYIATGYKKFWVLFDLENGHSWNKNDSGKGYAWIFPTRKLARIKYKKHKNSGKFVELSPPIKVKYK